jgi:pimeloyl-ACP methyl ester carboxylesterase
VATDLFVDAGGTRLAVRDHGGDGVPIVLVHGHLGNLAEYDELGPRLASHLRVVAYDQRGQGWSDPGPVSVDRFAADLAAVVAALELDRPVVFGSSFGALVGLSYVLAGGAARAFVNQDGRTTDFEVAGAPPAPPPPGPTVLPPDVWAGYVAGFGSVGPVGEATARRAGIRRPDGSHEVRPSREQVFEKEQAFGRLAVLDAYRALDGPALFLGARRVDRPRDEREAELARLAEHVDLQVRWFDTGHWISAEDVDGVARAVVDFVASIG